MAILQISKIQQRSGNLVDLPQLDDAEFGWANDDKRLFIGKTTPNENVEILTSYSTISFSQLDGAVGNLNISNVTLENGQVLTYDGTDWTNRGGNAGGLITLGDVSNVKITGGAVGYVLQTDGTGNLSWTPKGTLVADVLNVTKANPAVVTTVSENFFQDGAQITFLDPQGMTELAGNIYYANAITSTTFSLYTDSGLTAGVNSSAYNAYSYTTVSATTVSTNVITVANSSPFTIGSAVQFIGDMSTSNISNTATYYVQAKPNGTSLKIATSSDANVSNVVPLQTTSGLTAEVYQINGQAVATVGSSITFPVAGGSNTQVQYNGPAGALTGSSDFTYDYSATPKLLTLNGNANVGNLNATGVATATRLVSNIATGTAPLIVTSTTQVANLNVATSGSVVNGNSNVNIPSANGNVTISAIGNANIVVVTGTGVNVAGTFNASGNANVGNLGAATAIITTGNITTINSGLLQNGTSNVVVTAAGGNVTLGVAGTTRITATTTGANVTGTLGVSGNATTGNLSTTTAVITTGNITTINGGLLQNGNSNVTITANANITLTAKSNSTMVISDTGANITGTANVSGNANVGNLGTATAIITTGNITTINSGLLQNSTSNVTIASGGNVSVFVAGNATARAIFTSTGANIAGTANISGNANVGNIGAAEGVFTANITTTGNIYANSGTVGASLLTGTLTTALQPNITSVGTLSSLSVTGNTTVGNLIGPVANGNTNLNIPAANGNLNVTVAGNANVLVVTGTGVNVAGTLNVTGITNIAGNINFTGTKANLGSNANLTITGGSSGQLLSTDGSGNLSWASQGSIIGGAAGSNTQIQYNALGLLAASANFTFNYATNALTVTGNITGANLNTGGVVSATGNVSGGNITTGGVVAATGNVSGANLIATSYHIRSINAAVSAAGTVQANATALTKEINVVSTVASGAGVVLPTAVAGMVLIINNTSANTLSVYPAANAAINSGSANAAYSHVAGSSLQYYATSATQWYTVGATFA